MGRMEDNFIFSLQSVFKAFFSYFIWNMMIIQLYQIFFGRYAWYNMVLKDQNLCFFGKKICFLVPESNIKLLHDFANLNDLKWQTVISSPLMSGCSSSESYPTIDCTDCTVCTVCADYSRASCSITPGTVVAWSSY